MNERRAASERSHVGFNVLLTSRFWQSASSSNAAVLRGGAQKLLPARIQPHGVRGHISSSTAIVPISSALYSPPFDRVTLFEHRSGGTTSQEPGPTTCVQTIPEPRNRRIGCIQYMRSSRDAANPKTLVGRTLPWWEPSGRRRYSRANGHPVRLKEHTYRAVTWDTWHPARPRKTPGPNARTKSFAHPPSSTARARLDFHVYCRARCQGLGGGWPRYSETVPPICIRIGGTWRIFDIRMPPAVSFGSRSGDVTRPPHESCYSSSGHQQRNLSLETFANRSIPKHF